MIDLQMVELSPIHARCLVRWLDATDSAHSTIWRSIAYHLLVTSLSWAQGDVIVHPLYSKTLPKLGAVGSFPLIYRYAPPTYGGLNLWHPYVEQGILHIHFFLEHASLLSLLGQLMRALYEQALLEVGLPGCLFDLDFTQWGMHHPQSFVCTL